MPLFHIHGLIAATLSSLGAGASVFCSSGFNAFRFFTWFQEANPTWWTAVPTMHQTILTRAAQNAAVIAANPLRFVRSSSSSMPPQVIAEIEATFGCPLIEAYGMTEASHQMASNPLRGPRKPGSVGVAAGPEVAVMDMEGRLLGPGETGEVVIRGANVTAGYENNPKANAETLKDGWLRTGDVGRLDQDGFLTLSDRSKDVIISGGTNIYPREVEEALLTHPDVREVSAIGVPDSDWGEIVVACVVLENGAAADDAGLDAHCLASIARFKRPKRYVYLDALPKNNYGKVLKTELRAMMGKR